MKRLDLSGVGAQVVFHSSLAHAGQGASRQGSLIGYVRSALHGGHKHLQSQLCATTPWPFQQALGLTGVMERPKP